MVVAGENAGIDISNVLILHRQLKSQTKTVRFNLLGILENSQRFTETQRMSEKDSLKTMGKFVTFLLALI